jgi:hypothetical protein
MFSFRTTLVWGCYRTGRRRSRCWTQTTRFLILTALIFGRDNTRLDVNMLCIGALGDTSLLTIIVGLYFCHSLGLFADAACPSNRWHNGLVFGHGTRLEKVGEYGEWNGFKQKWGHNAFPVAR